MVQQCQMWVYVISMMSPGPFHQFGLRNIPFSLSRGAFFGPLRCDVAVAFSSIFPMLRLHKPVDSFAINNIYACNGNTFRKMQCFVFAFSLNERVSVSRYVRATDRPLFRFGSLALVRKADKFFSYAATDTVSTSGIHKLYDKQYFCKLPCERKTMPRGKKINTTPKIREEDSLFEQRLLVHFLSCDRSFLLSLARPNGFDEFQCPKTMRHIHTIAQLRRRWLVRIISARRKRSRFGQSGKWNGI